MTSAVILAIALGCSSSLPSWWEHRRLTRLADERMITTAAWLVGERYGELEKQGREEDAASAWAFLPPQIARSEVEAVRAENAEMKKKFEEEGF